MSKQFLVGTTVKNKVDGEVFTLGRDGYLSHRTGAIKRYSDDLTDAFSWVDFTDENFDRIKVVAEEFHPGDIVMDDNFPSYLYALGDEGYISLTNGGSYRYHDEISVEFPSDRYTRVNLDVVTNTD